MTHQRHPEGIRFHRSDATVGAALASPADELARALSKEWERTNLKVFGGALLRPPSIEVSPGLTYSAGTWDPQKRSIRFSEQFVTERPWWVVLEVLKHEMAHQYVTDVLGADSEESAHGPAFRMVCERSGIDARASHAMTEGEGRLVKKARKLLALSESSNEHEAQAALAAARKLLGRSGLTEADVDEQGADGLGAVSLRTCPGRNASTSWRASQRVNFSGSTKKLTTSRPQRRGPHSSPPLMPL